MANEKNTRRTRILFLTMKMMMKVVMMMVMMIVMMMVMHNLMIATRYQSQIPVSPSASSDQLGEEEESSNQE